VFLSSHLLHEIEQVCNRAVIINKGRVVVEGTVDELRPAGTAVKVLTRDQARATTLLRAQFGENNVMIDEKYLIVDGVNGSVPDLIRTLVAAELDIEAIVPAPEQGLEDYFLELTQSADVDAGYAGAGAANGGAQ
jgi:ABC-2 type transport system ATP-binding protein